MNEIRKVLSLLKKSKDLFQSVRRTHVIPERSEESNMYGVQPSGCSFKEPLFTTDFVALLSEFLRNSDRRFA